MKVRKSVFPVAGLGTRFLPATKANPKEMLPIVDKPLIQYAVEEAVASGITELIFVTNSSKHAIEAHFDKNYELEARLAQRGQDVLLTMVENILPPGVSSVYIRQTEPRGLGDAVLCAKELIGEEPFAVLLADDLIDAETPCLKQLIDNYTDMTQALFAVQEVPFNQLDKYGIIGPSPDQIYSKVNKIVEKPGSGNAPSNFGVIGRYILPPSIFSYLEKTSPDSRYEIQLTDAIADFLADGEVYAYRFKGKRYDCGNKLGYLKAIINYALKHQEIGEQARQFLATLRV